ncbi:DNA polymerase IV [Ruminococcaceae bacterium OttesenSCG-928-D13]|nr:DNA polymerase IV [Ruminococcaceae bacterium OttesenSCG-928-D13]
MSDRIVLHVDCNSFFASVSLLYKPWLQNKPVVVGGDEATRHGIVLAKNQVAKKYKIPTGAALWQAKQLCPDLVVIPPDYELYERFSKEIKERIFADYTDLQESFGSDESWLDITGTAHLHRSATLLANEIRQRIKREMGITVSVGHSWNKIFAKLGSDLKKPDGYVVIDKDNFKDTVWPLPVEEMLYVGPATKRKLNNKGVYTLGELAQTEEQFLRDWFGKIGSYLWLYANGEDSSPVGQTEPPVKNVGNSSVVDHDVTSPEEVKQRMFGHAENVGRRMREHGFIAKTMKYWICDNDMGDTESQCPMLTPSNLDVDLALAAFHHFQKTYRWAKPIRKIGITATNLMLDNTPFQITLWRNAHQHEKRVELQTAMDGINKRWPHSLKRGITMFPGFAAEENTKDLQRKFTPIGWLKGG